MSRRAAALAALAAAASGIGLMVAAAPAAAGPFAAAPLQRGLSDGGLFGSPVPALRAGAARVGAQARVTIARLPIAWSTVVRERRFARPAGAPVPLSDPRNPVYDWARIDDAVRDLAARGLTPMAYFMTAPKWAESAPRYPFAPAGTWAPRPTDLADFASAVARRYDGAFPDPARPGAPLPRIDRFQSWNEPNLGRFLQPLWVPSHGRAQLFAAGWYRRMHRAVERAIHARQPGALVGLAGLAPTGSAIDGDARVAPIRFLRAVLCVGAERPRHCGAPLHVDAIAVHPLSTGDPDLPAEFADDLAVADVEPKIEQVVAAAQAARQLAGGRRPTLWVTELNWITAGPGRVPATQQALVVGRAIRRLWQAGASIVNWQFAVDPVRSRTTGQRRSAGLTTRRRGTPAGLPGRAKPFLAGFALPTVAVWSSRGEAYLWALAPPPARRVVFEVRRRGRWRAVASLAVAHGAAALRRRLPAGTAVRAVAAGRPGPPITVRRLTGFEPWGPGGRSARAARAGGGARSGAVGRGAATRSAARPRAVSPLDPRLPDAHGPGPFALRPPLLEGGMPPPAAGESPPLQARRRTRTGPLTFRSPGPTAVVFGTRGVDRFVGPAALFVGFAGRDRLSGPPGRLAPSAGRPVGRPAP